LEENEEDRSEVVRRSNFQRGILQEL